ncbi:unnamed protein product, partial [Bubo scandiacus]
MWFKYTWAVLPEATLTGRPVVGQPACRRAAGLPSRTDTLLRKEALPAQVPQTCAAINRAFCRGTGQCWPGRARGRTWRQLQRRPTRPSHWPCSIGCCLCQQAGIRNSYDEVFLFFCWSWKCTIDLTRSPLGEARFRLRQFNAFEPLQGAITAGPIRPQAPLPDGFPSTRGPSRARPRRPPPPLSAGPERQPAPRTGVRSPGDRARPQALGGAARTGSRRRGAAPPLSARGPGRGGGGKRPAPGQGSGGRRRPAGGSRDGPSPPKFLNWWPGAGRGGRRPNGRARASPQRPGGWRGRRCPP